MNKKKTILAAVVLLLVFVVGGAIAYFTDTDSATNTFTIGNVDIEVLEPAWDQAGGSDVAEDMMPGETALKDPKIHNISTTNPAYVFMKVESPCTTGTPAVELFDYTNPDVDGGVNAGWELFSDGTCASGKITRIYSYSNSGAMTELAGNGNTPTLFDSLTLNTAVTGNLPANTDVVITGYGIQSEGLGTTDPATVWANFS